MFKFNVNEFVPEKFYTELKEIRKKNKAELKKIIKNEAAARIRRKELTKDGNLMIIAADHPARGITSSGVDEIGMAQRLNFLGRILRVIAGNNDVDGVMGTPDVIEDLIILNIITKKYGGEDFLNNRLLIGCMNRLGLKDTIFELDDGMSAYKAEYIQEMGLDGVKLMFRFCPQSVNSKKTIEYCLKAMNECHKLDIPVFLEALAVDKNAKQKKDLKSLLVTVCIANGLSTSSIGTWLKLPYIKESEGLTYRDIIASTTYPILVLGGAATGKPEDLASNVNEAMDFGASGGLIGRQILFSPTDPYAVGKAISYVIHSRKGKESSQILTEAKKLLKTEEGKNIDFFKKRTR